MASPAQALALIANLEAVPADLRRSLAADPAMPPEVLQALAGYEPDLVLANPALPLLEASGEWRWEALDRRAWHALARSQAFPRTRALWLRDRGRAAWADGVSLGGLDAGAMGAILNQALPATLRQELVAAYWISFTAEWLTAVAADPVVGEVVALMHRAAPRVGRGPLSAEDLGWLWRLGGKAHELLVGEREVTREQLLVLLDAPSAFIRYAVASKSAVIDEVGARFRRTHERNLAAALALNPAADAILLGDVFHRYPDLAPGAVLHPHLPFDWLEKLAAKPDYGLRQKLLSRNDLPVELRWKLTGRHP